MLKKIRDEIKMLSNMVELLEVRLGENESELIFNTKTTSWLKEDNKKIKLPKGDFVTQLLHQRDENSELNVTPRAKI